MNDTDVVSDEVWLWLGPLLPAVRVGPGRPWRDHRQVLEGIVFKYRTGCPWRDLPARYGPWQTVWKRHDLWSRDGTWQRLWRAAQARADAAGKLDWLVAVDSSIVRAHQHAAGARPVRGGGVESHQVGLAATG